jgi:hypothetical protein
MLAALSELEKADMWAGGKAGKKVYYLAVQTVDAMVWKLVAMLDAQMVAQKVALLVL